MGDTQKDGIQKIVILGGPGDGLVILEAVRQAAAAGHPVEVVGFLNDGLPKGTLFQDLPVFGSLPDWQALPENVRFYPALRKLKDMPRRVALIEGLGIPAERWASVIHPTAIVAGNVTVGHGSYIGPYVVIQPNAKLGAFLSIRNGANIGHDVCMEDFSGVGPHVSLSGYCSLGRGSQVAASAVVGNNARVGAFSMVGMCSAVARDVPDYALAMGNPARIIESLREVSHV